MSADICFCSSMSPFSAPTMGATVALSLSLAFCLASTTTAFHFELAVPFLLPVLPLVPVALTDFQPRATPQSYLKDVAHGRTATPPPPVLVCYGDSLTHGSVSSNWVDQLQDRFSHMTVLNAGVNSETAVAAHERLESVLACKPSAVTVLIGTNDLIGSLASCAADMYAFESERPARASHEPPSHSRS